MQAIEFDRFGPPDVMVLRECPIPSIAKDELLVKVVAASVNPKDTFVRKGRFQLMSGRKFPKRLGWDFAGVVEQVGIDANIFSAGDRVFGCLNTWTGGTCAEYVAVKATETALLPDEISFEKGAAMPVAALTALQALRDTALLKADQRVCINGGSGGVGSFAIQIARIFGARVTAIASERNADFCEGLGAEEFIDYDKFSIEKRASRFDVFFDVFGNKSFGQIRELLFPGGVYITTVPSRRILRDMLSTLLFTPQRARLISVRSKTEDLEWLADKVVKGRLICNIDKVFPLHESRDAHKHVESKHTRGKVVLIVQS